MPGLKSPHLASKRLESVIREIDNLNSADPRRIDDGNGERPQEVLYSERMSAVLGKVYPEASELLRIAAYAQHLRRWEVPRQAYPLGLTGYNAWRKACREHHVALIKPIMFEHGYGAGEAAHVASLISKENLKSNPESQALENVAGLVFVQHYLADFLAAHPGYSEDKVIGIIAKTLRKMSADGRDAVLALELPTPVRELIAKSAAALPRSGGM